jgi:hypothetical protein
MVFIYRLLGVVARLNERLSHFRVNFVPINLVIMVVLCGVSLFGLIEFSEGIRNGDKPVPRTVAEVLKRKDMSRNFVTVTGELHPEAGFQEMTKDKYGTNERPTHAYVVLLDEKDDVAILVQRDANDFDNGKPVMTQITGMLDEMGSDMQTKLHENGGKIGDVSIDTQYMLTEGRQPGNPVVGGAVAILFGLASLAFIVTLLSNYIVFQKTGSDMPSAYTTQAALTPQQSIDLRATGRFVLDQRNAKRFLNVPAGIATGGGGEMVIVSNIDASSKLYGFTTQKLSGYWTIVLEPTGLKKVEMGQLYDGPQGRPALRVFYKDHKSRTASAILSFANTTERETVLNELHRIAGYNMARS